MNELPLVSIICTSYNHGKYISQALEGFVMQNITFPIEIIVHDDASSDNTAKIIRAYEAKYPGMFMNIYQTENQYSKGNGDVARFIFSAARGKYIAICEGDDYWTDPYKLQKQVDFLEAHPEFSLSCHNVEVVGEVQQNSYIENVKEFYTATELASGEISIPTLSVVFRNYKFDYPDSLSKTPIGDFPLFTLIAQFGKIKYFPEIMGARRVHKGGIWSSADRNAKLSALLTTIYFMIGNYKEEINKALIQYHLKLVAGSIKEGIAIDLYPKEMVWVVKIMYRYKKTKAVLSALGLIKLVRFVSGIIKK